MTLTLQDISFVRNEHILFSKINCTVYPGQILQIMGPNGCGKSTLLRMVAGFLTPETGEILWQNQTIDKTFQQSLHYIGHQYSLKSHLTVEDNLKLFASLKKQKINFSILKEITTFLDIHHLLFTKVVHLSAGQLRRVALAKLFIFKTKLWLLDEPLTALDTKTQEKMIDLFKKHLNNHGMILAATHQYLPFEQNSLVLHLGYQVKC